MHQDMMWHKGYDCRRIWRDTKLQKDITWRKASQIMRLQPQIGYLGHVYVYMDISRHMQHIDTYMDISRHMHWCPFECRPTLLECIEKNIWTLTYFLKVLDRHARLVQGGAESKDAFSCRRSFSAKEPLIIGHFCGKWPIQIRQPMTLHQPVRAVTTSWQHVYTVTTSSQQVRNKLATRVHCDDKLATSWQQVGNTCTL